MRNDHVYHRVSLAPEVIEAAMRRARVERSRAAAELFSALVAWVRRALAPAARRPAPRQPAAQCC